MCKAPVYACGASMHKVLFILQNMHAWQVHPNGEVGQALDALQPGDKVALKGPFGKYVYKPGKFKAIGATLQPGTSGLSTQYLRAQAKAT